MSRYRIKRVPFTVEGERPYGLWDTRERVYVDKWGTPSPSYWAITREVAVMRRRDLNEYEKAKP